MQREKKKKDVVFESLVGASRHKPIKNLSEGPRSIQPKSDINDAIGGNGIINERCMGNRSVASF